jgi:YspA, cpYpsA-related SLOG family
VRLLVTGSQRWTDVGVIEMALLAEVIDMPVRGIMLVHGACPEGADLIAARFARRRGWDVEAHPADWARYGNRAGQIRNERMVNLGADVCLAFIRDQSPGASTTVFKARRKGIRTVVWRHEGERIWLDEQKVDVSRVHPDQGSLF